LFSILPIPAAVLGSGPGVFNARFQCVLFSGIDFAMVYIIWSVGYSWLSFPAVVLLCVFFRFLFFNVWSVFYTSPNCITGVIANIRNTLYSVVIFLFLAVFFTKLKFRR